MFTERPPVGKKKLKTPKKTTSSFGRRTAVQNALDTARADFASKKPTHRVDLILAKSPEKKVIAAGVVTYRIFQESAELPDEVRQETMGEDPGNFLQLEGEPIKIRDPDKNKKAGIIRAFLQELEKYSGKVVGRLVCPGLKILRTWSPIEVSTLVANPRELHQLVDEIYTLMDKDYTWDAKEDAIIRRRGREFGETPINVTTGAKSE